MKQDNVQIEQFIKKAERYANQLTAGLLALAKFNSQTYGEVIDFLMKGKKQVMWQNNEILVSIFNNAIALIEKEKNSLKIVD